MPDSQNPGLDFKTISVLGTIICAAAGSGFWLSTQFADVKQQMADSNAKTRETVLNRFTGIELRLTKLELLVEGKDPLLKVLPEKYGQQ